MENKWNLVLFVQPVICLVLILIGLYTFIAGSPHLLPWAFILMGPVFAAMGLYEHQRQNKNASILYLALATVSILFGFYSFTAF